MSFHTGGATYRELPEEGRPQPIFKKLVKTRLLPVLPLPSKYRTLAFSPGRLYNTCVNHCTRELCFFSSFSLLGKMSECRLPDCTVDKLKLRVNVVIYLTTACYSSESFNCSRNDGYLTRGCSEIKKKKQSKNKTGKKRGRKNHDLE